MNTRYWFLRQKKRELKSTKFLSEFSRSRIPERERLLIHEMKWSDNNYGSDGNVKTAPWWMQICSDADQERSQPLAMAIYASFGGNGYCPNCSIDENGDTAMGKASGLTLGQFFLILIKDAILAQENLEAKASDYINLEFLPAAVAIDIGDGGIKHAIDLLF
ncbi:hypothetical protein BGX21_009068 [Mortierella sp. AD011]|nr:hypothetical protein BGX20_008873 [Mortierella sp. AD010]KAF9397248.1 hypothetical protein BGX21_009068 [Mortierella sp. AD011]